MRHDFRITAPSLVIYFSTQDLIMPKWLSRAIVAVAARIGRLIGIVCGGAIVAYVLHQTPIVNKHGLASIAFLVLTSLSFGCLYDELQSHKSHLDGGGNRQLGGGTSPWTLRPAALLVACLAFALLALAANYLELHPRVN